MYARKLAVVALSLAAVGRAGGLAAWEAQKLFVEDTEFKPVAGGWVFRAPIAWYFGRRPHYLVNETQKARIAAILAASQIVNIMLVLPLCLAVFLGFPAVLSSIAPNTTDPFPLMMILLSVLGLPMTFLQNLYNCLALRESLRLLPLAAEKPTLADRLRAQGSHISVRDLIFLLLVWPFGIFIRYMRR
jgi:hypothetical protein